MPAVSLSSVEISRKELQDILRMDEAACIRRTFNTWISMLDRCMIPGHAAAESYRDRGIRVCERWFLFANFVADMGGRPEDMTLDRIDVNGDYEPGNCRWATQFEQARNTRRNVRLQGVIQRDAAQAAGVHESTLTRRRARGYSDAEAIDSAVIRRMKLARRDVDEIRLALARGETQRELAARYSVSRQTINSISRGETWPQ